jgi:acyl carrier protein
MEALEEVADREVGPLTVERSLADLGLDSVAMAELLVVLEDKLEVTLDEGELASIKTLGDIQALVLKAAPSEKSAS